MKRVTMIYLIVFILSVLALNAYAQEETEEPQVLKIIIDGKMRSYNNPPVIVNGRTLLPLRAIVNDLGIPDKKELISWNSLDQSIHISYNRMDVMLQIGQTIVVVNGKEQTLDVGPMIINDITYVPVRFISQTFGKKVVWEPVTFCVLITDVVMYEVVHDLIKKSNEAVNQIIKYKSNMQINVVMSIPKFDLNYNMSMNTVEMKDRSKQYVYSLEESILQDNSKSIVQTYIADHSSYVMEDTKQWEKKLLSDTEWDQVFNGNLGIGAQDNIQQLSAGLQLKRNDVGEIVLVGDMYLSKLFQMGKGTKEGGFRIEDCELEIVINQNNFFPRTYRMNVHGEMTQNEQPILYNSDILLTYSEVNGDVEIVLPMELGLTKNINQF